MMSESEVKSRLSPAEIRALESDADTSDEECEEELVEVELKVEEKTYGKWFNKQAPAITHMQEKNHKIFVKRGNYQFGSFEDQEDFIESMMDLPVSERIFYEVLLEEKPQRMFCDIDGGRLNPLELYTTWNKLMAQVFEELKMEFNPDLVRILDSSKGPKISGHWSYIGKAFKDCKEQKKFWEFVESVIERDYDQMTTIVTKCNGAMHWASVLDMSVYSRNRAFRTIYCHKEGSDRILNPIKIKNEKIKLIKNINALEYLIYAPDEKDFYDITYPAFATYKNKELTKDKLDKVINALIPNVSIREIKDNFIVLKNEGPRMCIIGGEINDSDNCYVVWRKSGLYFGCHDSQCTGKHKQIFSCAGSQPKISGKRSWDSLRMLGPLCDDRKKYNDLCTQVIEHMNDSYSFITQGPKTIIAKESPEASCKINPITKNREPNFTLCTKDSIRDQLANKIIHTKYIPEGEKKVKIIDPFALWFTSARRREFTEGCVFEPFPEGKTAPLDTANKFNMWRGYAVKHSDVVMANEITPATSPFLHHIFKRWCKGKRDVYDWVIGWMAYALQKPHLKLHSAIVLKGKEGCVKGLPVQILATIIGQNLFYQPSSIDEVLGDFTDGLEAKKIIYLDEVAWGGDKQKAGGLKKLITEEQISMKKKFIATTSLKNVMGVFIASNEEWAVPAGISARRYCVLDVDGELAGISDRGRAELNKIIKESEDPEFVKSFAKLLYEYDLKDFNDRQPPQTEGLRHQKILSFRPMEKFAYQLLVDGEINHEDAHIRFSSNVCKNVLYECYKKTSGDKHTTKKLFWDKMGEILCNDEKIFRKTKPVRIKGKLTRAICLPSLNSAREAFKSWVQDPTWGFEEDEPDTLEEKEEIESDEDTDEEPPRVSDKTRRDLPQITRKERLDNILPRY